MLQISMKTMYKYLSVSIHEPPTPRFSIVSKSFVKAAEAGIDH